MGELPRLLRVYCSVGLCMGFSAVMIKAGGTLLSEAFGLQLTTGAVLVALITASYTAWGGLRTSIVTDVFQFVFFLLVLGIFGCVLIFSNWSEAPLLSRDAVAATKLAMQKLGVLRLGDLALAFLLGEMLIPPYAARVLAGKSPRASKYGFLLAGLFGVLWFSMMVPMGIVLKHSLGEGVDPDRLLIAGSVKLLPAAGAGFVVAALLAVIMSSLDSLLNAAAVSGTRNFVKRQGEPGNRAVLTACAYDYRGLCRHHRSDGC